MGWFTKSKQTVRRHTCKPGLELLETRAVPALIASQFTLNPPTLDDGVGPGELVNEVKILLDRAQVATASNDAIIAVVDRQGNILGVRAEGGVSPAITGTPDLLAFAVDGAVAKARTGAFFGNDQAPLTSRTVGFISQSTITEREVNSNPNDNNPNSTQRGPGFVAAVKTGAHFPPDVDFTPPVDLFGIEHTNRDSILHPGADFLKGTMGDIPLPSRFNVALTDIPAGQGIAPPISYGETRLTLAQRLDPNFNHFQSRGIATLPGGIPIYEDGVVVGGIGVFFPGMTGFATEENFQGSQTFDPTKPDRTLEAEFMALAAVGGSSGFGFPVGDLPGAPALAGFDLPSGRIDLVGVTLDVVGPGGNLGPANLVFYAQHNLGVGQGTLVGGMELPVDNDITMLYKDGMAMPEGWLVTPHDGVGISAAEVERIIMQGINEANLVRAQIRIPNDERTRMVFAVADSTGEVLGLFRMPDATVFSVDVAVAKARNTAYYNDPAQLQPEDRVAELPPGAALTNRTFRFLAEPRFPEGIDGEFGAFSILNDPGVDPRTARQVGAPQPASAYQSVYGFDAFNPGSNFRQPTNIANQNGVVFFPGSSGVYKNVNGVQTIVGGFGVSGDGVDQDDVVTHFGIDGFQAPSHLRADQFFVSRVRLPYIKFPRNPEN